MPAYWPSSHLSLAVISASVFQLDKNLDQKAEGRILRPQSSVLRYYKIDI